MNTDSFTLQLMKILMTQLQIFSSVSTASSGSEIKSQIPQLTEA